MTRERVVEFLKARLTAVTGVCVGIVVVASLVSLAAPWSDFADILTSFRHLFAGSLLLGAVVLAALRHLRGATVALLFALLNGFAVAPLYLPSAECQGSVTAVTLNALGPDNDVTATVEMLRRAEPHVVGVTELGSALDARLRQMFPHAVSHPSEGTGGMGLFSKYPLSAVETLPGGWFPQIWAVADVAGRPVRLAVVHPAPPLRKESSTLRNEEIVGIAARIRTSEVPTVLLGDLNVTRHSPHFDPLLEAGLQDSRAGRGVLGTWPAGLPFRVGIDHVMVSSDFQTCSLRTGPANGSDHLPVIGEFKF